MLAVQDRRKLKMGELVTQYEAEHLIEMEAEIQKAKSNNEPEK